MLIYVPDEQDAVAVTILNFIQDTPSSNFGHVAVDADGFFVG
jgi:hypothetical protein